MAENNRDVRELYAQKAQQDKEVVEAAVAAQKAITDAMEAFLKYVEATLKR